MSRFYGQHSDSSCLRHFLNTLKFLPITVYPNAVSRKRHSFVGETFMTVPAPYSFILKVFPSLCAFQSHSIITFDGTGTRLEMSLHHHTSSQCHASSCWRMTCSQRLVFMGSLHPSRPRRPYGFAITDEVPSRAVTVAPHHLSASKPILCFPGERTCHDVESASTHRGDCDGVS